MSPQGVQIFPLSIYKSVVTNMSGLHPVGQHAVGPIKRRPEMPHRSHHLTKRTLIAALITLSAGVTIAGAGDRHDRHRGPGGGHLHSSTCGCPSYIEYAGSITIDGHTTRIRTDRSMLPQIARAFEDAGYHAWVSRGRLQVDYGRCRPSVQWRRDRYTAGFDWDRGRLSVSLRRYRAPSIRNRQYDHNRRPARRIIRRTTRWGTCR